MSTESRGFAVNEADFDRLVLQASHERPVLVDFWAEWCAPCIHLAPVLDRFMEQVEDRLILAKVEVDAGENMRLAGRYRLKGFPTVLLFRDGIELERFSGTKPLGFMREFAGRHLT